MKEENQVTKEPQQVQREPQQVTREPQRVTMKDPKKVEAGKRLASISRKKREAKKREEQAQLERTASGMNQYYGIGSVLAVGVIGGIGCYIYRSKKEQVSQEVPNRALQAPAGAWTLPGSLRNPLPQQPHPETNKFEMD